MYVTPGFSTQTLLEINTVIRSVTAYTAKQPKRKMALSKESLTIKRIEHVTTGKALLIIKPSSNCSQRLMAAAAYIIERLKSQTTLPGGERAAAPE